MILLPAETVRVILLPAETLGRKQNHKDSLCRKPFFVDDSLDSSEARDHRQSQRKPNMTDNLCKKRKVADLFIPCEDGKGHMFVTITLKCLQHDQKRLLLWLKLLCAVFRHYTGSGPPYVSVTKQYFTISRITVFPRI